MSNEILILHPNKANLPELQAYQKYFSKDFNITISSNYNQEMNKFDIIWIIMGTKSVKKTRENQIIIHEYASLSTGRFPKIKNFIKKMIANKPDLRIFLNEFIKDEMNFKDNVKFCYRDMGIAASFFDNRLEKTSMYDFVYVGDISKSRKMDIFLDNFIENHSEKLLLVGSYDEKIYDKFFKYKNITFTGRISYNDVPKMILQAKYALNIIPNKYPYYLQTSTKLQEYVALGINVITTDGTWVRKFERKNNCNFFYIRSDDFSFNDNYKTFGYVSCLNEVDFLWNSILKKSQIQKTIESIRIKKNE